MIGMRLQQKMGLICKVCQRLYDSEEAGNAAVMAVLLGAVRFAICFCGMECGPELMKDRHYRIRWNRELRRRKVNG